MIWTDEWKQRLRDAYAQGIPPKEFAKRHNLTRNQVCGAADRLGLSAPRWSREHANRVLAAKGQRPRANPKRPPSEPRPIRVRDRSKEKRPKPNREERTIGALVMRASKAALPIGRKPCCYPMWGNERIGTKAFFCNAPAVEGLPYCRAHCLISYETWREPEHA